MIDTRVVIKASVLHGSQQPGQVQLVAIAYMLGEEFKVVAPADATGKALGWIKQFSVRQQVDLVSDAMILDVRAWTAIGAVEEELKKLELLRTRTPGKHPDGLHCDALICKTGHIQSCDGTPFNAREHCTICGASCQDECRTCLEPIRGVELLRPATDYPLPRYCHGCGQAYPWTQAATEKINQVINESQLSVAEKREAKDELDLILRNTPGAESAARRTHERLAKVGGVVRAAYADYVVPLVAETLAKILKG
jgi:hypothetical protein